MRRVGHDLDVELLRDDYREYLARPPEDASERRREKRRANLDYFTDRAEDALTIARLAYLFGAPLEDIRHRLSSALPDLQAIIELGGTLSPIEMREYLGAALVAQDDVMVRWLALLPREAYTLEDLEVSDAGYALIAALQFAALGDRETLPGAVRKFREALAPGRLVVDPRSEKLVYGPIADLLAALAAHDQTGFDTAWRRQAETWRKRHGRSSERANPDGILDLEALGIGRIAGRFGLTAPNDNPYAPGELLKVPGEP